MLRVTALFLFTFSLSALFAQITIGPDWLMAPGFQMALYSNDYDDPDGNVAKSGANQTWTFAQLGVNDTSYVVVKETDQGSAGANFANADMFFTTRQNVGFGVGSVSEIYLQRAGNDLNIVGIADVSTDAVIPPFVLNDPLLFQSTPLTYLSQSDDNTFIRLAYSADVLFQLLQDSTLAAFVDSVGINLSQAAITEVDGWGTVALNGTSYDALRMRSVVESSQEVEVKAGFLGWVPISSQVPGVDSTLDFGDQRTESYSWIVPEFSYPLVQVTLDSNGLASVITYRADIAVNNRTPIANIDFNAYQVGGQIQVDLQTELANQTGEIRILSSNGSFAARQDIQLSNDQIQINIDGMPKGIQLVTLWSAQGKLMAVKRVLIH